MKKWYATILALAILMAPTRLAAKGASLTLQDFLAARGVTGSVTVYDLAGDSWITSDDADSRVATLPASTFKIPNALIALEEGVARPGETVPWDGVERGFKGKPIAAWNADADIERAFRNSTIWFFARLSGKIDRATYANRLRELRYGNGDLGETGDDFWNYGPFAVTPREEATFLARLYRGDLPFKKEHVALVREWLRAKTDGSYALSAKTGWAVKDGRDIGWYVGYLETNGKAYAFATRIVADEGALRGDFGATRIDATLEAFRRLGIIAR